ncbi:hypothetical protein [Geothrix sp. PMB-07]|uniref:hypothetical protein n=1 Tax=Geothrix sp. PMB-07 TaxID=3068640 RepID=UPI0027416F6E|nr:hypothetical protein [Geothrix sp. PMB-07]WLT32175.1 hypothetical protein Q9293_02360 [Geothrix sp. PMB-07]
MATAQTTRHSLRSLLLPDQPRSFAWARPAQLALRSLHIAVMALVVGGLPFGADFHRLRIAILMTVASGVLLMAIDLAKDAAFLLQGSGVALLVKLALLGLGLLQPEARLPWYLAATLVASIGSHMPGAWRHYSFLTGKSAKESH